MALTGLGFLSFLTLHLSIMVRFYSGRAAFEAYLATVHALGRFRISVLESLLLICTVFHIVTGLIIFFRNRRARPIRYTVKKAVKKQTFAAKVMPWTGLLLIGFLLMHLVNFRFADKTATTYYDMVSGLFNQPVVMIIYTLAMLVVALHISHGFWSIFQTLGFRHPRYAPVLKAFGIVVSALFGAGFGFLPLYFLLFS